MKSSFINLLVSFFVIFLMTGCEDERYADRCLSLTVYRTNFYGFVISLPGADIYINGKKTLTRTDRDGKAVISSLPDKIFEISVEHFLYGSVTETVDMRFNKQQEIRLHLNN